MFSLLRVMSRRLYPLSLPLLAPLGVAFLGVRTPIGCSCDVCAQVRQEMKQIASSEAGRMLKPRTPNL